MFKGISRFFIFWPLDYIFLFCISLDGSLFLYIHPCIFRKPVFLQWSLLGFWQLRGTAVEHVILNSVFLPQKINSHILVKLVFQEFTGVLVFHSDPFLGKGFLFGIYLSTNLASDDTFCTRLSILDITYLRLSNSQSFVDSR